jgi:hypothetical protein
MDAGKRLVLDWDVGVHEMITIPLTFIFGCLMAVLGSLAVWMIGFAFLYEMAGSPDSHVIELAIYATLALIPVVLFWLGIFGVIKFT